MSKMWVLVPPLQIGLLERYEIFGVTYVHWSPLMKAGSNHRRLSRQPEACRKWSWNKWRVLHPSSPAPWRSLQETQRTVVRCTLSHSLKQTHTHHWQNMCQNPEQQQQRQQTSLLLQIWTPHGSFHGVFTPNQTRGLTEQTTVTAAEPQLIPPHCVKHQNEPWHW